MPQCLVLDQPTHSSIRDIFLRELVSNANDALEKLRITSLTDKSIWDGSSALNVTIKAERDADGKGGRIVITGKYSKYSPKGPLMGCTRHRDGYELGRACNQLGMRSKLWLYAAGLNEHQGTLAKSGTSEFAARVEGGEEGGVNGNLIGAFGVGFYSRCFDISYL